MSKQKNNSHSSKNRVRKDKDINQKGYPLYDESEDIYEKFEEESDINPANISKEKDSNSTNVLRQEELDRKRKIGGKDLDVPGSELDDEQEDIGSEDEENNYYSLGGDDHNDLEEDT